MRNRPGLLTIPIDRNRTSRHRGRLLLILSSVGCLSASEATRALGPLPTGPRTPDLAQPVAVFGADDRVVLPQRLKSLEGRIGLLYEPRTRSVCTAFCVGESTVATAAHCLFRTRGERALPFGSVTFRLGTRKRTGVSRIAGSGTGAAAQNVVTGSTSLSTRPPIDATKDWALVRLATPACRAGVLPLSHRSPADLAAEDADRQVYQVGFHGDFGNWRLTLSPPCAIRRPAQGPHGRAVAEDFSDAGTLILHTCDTGGASSGSPLLVDGQRGPEVVGINVGTYLQSRVLTQAGEVVHRYKSDTVANTAVSTQAFQSQVDEFASADVLLVAKDIRRVQSALAATGHYAGDVDGRYGTELRQAIQSFERSERRLPTGLASQALLRRLEAIMAGLKGSPDPQSPGPRLETGSVSKPTSGTR